MREEEKGSGRGGGGGGVAAAAAARNWEYDFNEAFDVKPKPFHRERTSFGIFDSGWISQWYLLGTTEAYD